MSEEYALELSNITKTFPGVKALDRVSFGVKKGVVHSLVGENGAGKSTLMKVINGMHKANEGTVAVHGKVVDITSPHMAEALGISMIFQELVYVPGLTVAENLCLGHHPTTKLGLVDWRKINKDAQELLDREGIHAKATDIMGEVRISDAQMIEIAKAVNKGADIVIMDEPTSSLTQHESETLFKKINELRDKGCSVIYISHKMEEVFQLSDYITIMRDGQSIQTGPISDFDEQKVIAAMVGREVSNLYPELKGTPGEVLLETKNLNAPGGKGKNINIKLRAGEIVGMAGLVGAGRTETVRAICGMDPMVSGEIILNGKTYTSMTIGQAIDNGLVMATEDRRKYGIVACRSIKENISLPNLKAICKAGFIQRKKEREQVQIYFDRLRIKANNMDVDALTLSGGNQQKLVLAKWMMSNPKVLILDEPTRGIDVGAKYEIYELMTEMAAAGMAVLMISSELPELLGMCKRIYVMAEGEVRGELKDEEISQVNVMKLATGGK